MNLLIHWLLSSIILWLVSAIIPGMAIYNFVAALLATFVLSVINLTIKPLISFLSLPINILTLGLFSFVINAFMLSLAAWVVPGFEINGFLSALIGSILLSILTGLMETNVPRLN